MHARLRASRQFEVHLLKLTRRRTDRVLSELSQHSVGAPAAGRHGDGGR